MTRSELIAALKEAKGADRELDDKIQHSFPNDFPIQTHGLLHFTGSVDDAIALVGRVRPGWWKIQKFGGAEADKSFYLVHLTWLTGGPDNYESHETSGVGDTPALALCIALLESMDENNSSA